MYIIIISSSNNNNSVAELPTHTRTHCGDKHGYTHSLSQADNFLCIADNSKALNLRLNFQNAYTHISSSHISYTYVHTYIYFLFMYIQMCVCMALCIFKRVHTEKIHQKLYYWLADWLTACFKGLFFFFAKVHTHTPITDGTSRMSAIQTVRHTRSCQYNWLNWVQMSVCLPVCMSDWRSDDWQAGLSQCLRHFQHIQYLLPELLGAQTQTHTHRTQNKNTEWGKKQKNNKYFILSVSIYRVNMPAEDDEEIMWMYNL